MNELVFIQNEQAITTSLKVAEIFEKHHKDVLEKLDFWQLKFPPRNLKMKSTGVIFRRLKCLNCQATSTAKAKLDQCI